MKKYFQIINSTVHKHFDTCEDAIIYINKHKLKPYETIKGFVPEFIIREYSERDHVYGIEATVVSNEVKEKCLNQFITEIENNPDVSDNTMSHSIPDLLTYAKGLKFQLDNLIPIIAKTDYKPCNGIGFEIQRKKEYPLYLMKRECGDILFNHTPSWGRNVHHRGNTLANEQDLIKAFNLE
ncbi:MAG: hypothetical protein WC979_03325 [Candidatus Pacearchaeota archaeon]|jgi:hypothetical protein|nr:hypothetical protein [Clostridia bacterium]